MRTQAGYAWRFIAIVAAVVLVGYGLMKVELVAIAFFLALVISALLRPVANLLNRWMPRALATVCAFIAGLALLAGIVTFVVVNVSKQYVQISSQLIEGIQRLDKSIVRLQNQPPYSKLGLGKLDLTSLGDNAQKWLQKNNSKLLSTALNQAGSAVEGVTAVILAVFCAIFIINSGRSMVTWFLSLVGAQSRPRWEVTVHSAWHAFSGYSRGIVLIALTNGVLVGVALAILKVPLAAPLAVLVFLGTFVPLIGAPVAMVLAAVVALAARGPWIALAVVVLIILIGQLEGHVLQPFIMGKSVSLHPIAVALSVASGTLIAGVVGAVVSVPIVSVVWAIYSHLREYNLNETQQGTLV